MSARISVVVPFYNNEDLLAECLDSIAAQTHRDLEVIMVDDASTDASAAIARARAAGDPRFTLLTVDHGGPGYARNRGVERASGEFLAFADGDDALPPGAYELLLATLQRSGSDFACGNVSRIGPGGINPSALHAQAIKKRRIGTHISADHRLFYDISVFNKLFRRSFWDAHALTYPEGMVWEDLQLMTRAHVLARAVDVIPECVYYWRERGKGGLSITQRRTDLTNLRDRVNALLAIDAFLRSRGEPGRAPPRGRSAGTATLLRTHQLKALRNDLWLYVQDLHRADEAYRTEFIRLVGDYLRQVRPSVLRSLPATHKLAYHLVSAGELPELVEFVAWYAQQPVKTVPVVRRHGRLVADLPVRGSPAVPLPRRVLRPHWRDLDPVVSVEDITWRDDRLVIVGYAYVPSIDVPRRRNTTKLVVLRPGGRRPPIVVPARSFRHPTATALSYQERYDYSWSGFRCEISPQLFHLGDAWLTGEWEAYVLVRGHGVWRPARLHTPAPGKAERPELRQVAPHVRFGARWVGRNLHVGVWPVHATFAGHALRRADADARTDAVLDIDVELTDAVGRGQSTGRAAGASRADLILVRDGGAVRHTFPTSPAATGAGDGRSPLCAQVPLRVLSGAAEDTEGAETVGWEVYVDRVALPPVRVAFPDRGTPGRHRCGDRELVVGANRHGDLELVWRRPHPVVTEHDWLPDGRLRLSGTWLNAPRPTVPAQAGPGRSDRVRAVLRRQAASEEQIVDLHTDGDRFTIEADVGALPSFGDPLPLRDGDWDVFVRRPARSGTASSETGGLVRVKYDHARLADVTERQVRIGAKLYSLRTDGRDDPVVAVQPALRPTEQGNFNQRLLRRAYYPLKLRAPLRDAVLFVSWKGKQCADNPRAIADELRRRGDDREHLWVVADWSVPAPPDATVVLYGTEEYYDALARSAYLVGNDDMQPPYRKRDGQFYLQTWHGTPLKRIGFDIERPQFISGTAYFDRLAADVAQWDLLLSPNPFSTPIMRRAFRYEGEVCESGYPRNDLLRLCCGEDGGSGTATVRRVRQLLGLPDGKRVVLYAPTWRDNQVYASGRRYRFDLRLDLARARAALGDDHVLLVRGHHQMADDVPTGAGDEFAVNVTDYPNISELFLVSDMLVTDYSSAMFDYAVTHRPMLFFAYDLAEYRDSLRGFYFDFEAEAPGPLLATSDEVLAAIRDVGAVAASHRAAYDAFATKFCPLDDGKAAARVCDRLLGN